MIVLIVRHVTCNQSEAAHQRIPKQAADRVPGAFFSLGLRLPATLSPIDPSGLLSCNHQRHLTTPTAPRNIKPSTTGLLSLLVWSSST